MRRPIDPAFLLPFLPDQNFGLMTLYLTETTVPNDVVAAAASGLISAVKLYPAGATTNSASGVRDFDKVTPVLEAMAENGIPLCVHGEVTDPDIDIFDRETVFLERVLDPLRQRIRGLRVVLEHVTTSDGVDYVQAGRRRYCSDNYNASSFHQPQPYFGRWYSPP